MTDPAPIGTTKGPGETPNEYTFITPDPEQRVKYGEFVHYSVMIEGTIHAIMGRVTARVPLRLYPNTFFSDPSVPPSDVAALLGYERSDSDLFEITATILGYFDATLGFVNPRIPPRSGTPIHMASDEMLSTVLCSLRPSDVGGVHIGSLLSRPGGRVPIVLNAREFTSTHIAIIASTGSGKSYLAGVILEELMRPRNRAAVLVVDPHGEYDTLAEIQHHAAFSEQDYRPEVRIVRPNDVRVRVSSLTLGDLRYLLPGLSEKMHYDLGRAHRRVRKNHGDRWTRDQLVIAVRSGEGERPDTDPSTDEKLDDPTVGALLWRLNAVLFNSSIFDDYRDLDLTELLRPGQCTVLQLNEIPEREQQIVVATLLRRLYQARVDTTRGRARASEPNHLPYPAFVLIEEAHNFAPAAADVVTTGILKQILSEGRKFGVGVGLISQRPGKLDSDVLSQCMTQCIMRIVNPIDQGRVAESVESVGRDLLGELPALSRGQVIVAGVAVNTPVLAMVRKRLTAHGAESPNAPEAWQGYFAPPQQSQRARDNAPPANSQRRRERRPHPSRRDLF